MYICSDCEEICESAFPMFCKKCGGGTKLSYEKVRIMYQRWAKLMDRMKNEIEWKNMGGD